MFRVGNLIVALEETNKKYCITNQKRGFVGRIIEVDESASSFDDNIRVEAIFLDGSESYGRKFWVKSSYFTLAKDNKLTISRMRGRR